MDTPGDILHIDIETYSPVDLKRFGVYAYSEHPDFLILMAAWSLNGAPVQLAIGDRDIWNIPGLWDSAVTKVAHNAQFERVCLSRFAGLPVDEFLPPEEWVDTQAIAAELGYPQKLEHLAKALGGEQKDTAGTLLINIFCKPNRKKARTLPEEKPDKWEQFCDYCVQDVATLIDVDRIMGGWPTDKERRAWEVDQHINDRGIKLDTAMARLASESAAANEKEQIAEFIRISGVENPGSLPQVHSWLQSRGSSLPNLKRETVEQALASTSIPPDVRQALELRQDLALVASKKFSSALQTVSPDGRLRGSFKFFGAHTGRWSGRGTQLHNLTRAHMKSDDHVEAAVLDLEAGFGADPQTLKALVRAMFIGPFVVSDYSAIEARVLAWLAHEKWALDAFNAGRDIYTETAQRMSSPSNQMDRAQGKVAVLALGYNGGVESLRAMGFTGTDNDGWELVRQWRKANPSIVRMWAQLEEAFCRGTGSAGRIQVEKDGKSRMLRLPSGRCIHYHNVSAKPAPKGRRLITMDDPRYGRGQTYGGRLTENVTQAVARDILSEALVRLHDFGHHVVGHVHDEVLVDQQPGSTPETVSEVMCIPPRWAKGLPIGSEGFVSKRYKKG